MCPPVSNPHLFSMPNSDPQALRGSGLSLPCFHVGIPAFHAMYRTPPRPGMGSYSDVDEERRALLLLHVGVKGCQDPWHCLQAKMQLEVPASILSECKTAQQGLAQFVQLMQGRASGMYPTVDSQCCPGQPRTLHPPGTCTLGLQSVGPGCSANAGGLLMPTGSSLPNSRNSVGRRAPEKGLPLRQCPSLAPAAQCKPLPALPLLPNPFTALLRKDLHRY